MDGEDKALHQALLRRPSAGKSGKKPREADALSGEDSDEDAGSDGKDLPGTQKRGVREAEYRDSCATGWSVWMPLTRHISCRDGSCCCWCSGRK